MGVKLQDVCLVQLPKAGGCFGAFMGNTTPILVQLRKGMYVRGFLLGEPSPARLTVLCFLALLGCCQILESSFFIYRYY